MPSSFLSMNGILVAWNHEFSTRVMQRFDCLTMQRAPVGDTPSDGTGHSRKNPR
jgi:hypothetical protein